MAEIIASQRASPLIITNHRSSFVSTQYGALKYRCVSSVVPPTSCLQTLLVHKKRYSLWNTKAILENVNHKGCGKFQMTRWLGDQLAFLKKASYGYKKINMTTSWFVFTVIRCHTDVQHWEIQGLAVYLEKGRENLNLKLNLN